MNNIINCTLADTGAILELYAAARSLQTERQMVVWPVLDAAFVEREINENRQWKLLENGQMVCNWATTFEDPDIWGEKDQNDAVYIHRICTHPQFRGKRLIDTLVAWADAHARQHQKAFVRLDTLGNNTRLIAHYTSAGFDFLGIHHLKNTANLPQHYQKEPDCCLFERKVPG
jgi:ribosomal protein S18 acetylase RimI-like enzyme